jgi:hypothetical protein
MKRIASGIMVMAVTATIAGASTTAAWAQANTVPEAPIGHRQPTVDSVDRAEAERGKKPEQPSQGRDPLSEPKICSDC